MSFDGCRRMTQEVGGRTHKIKRCLSLLLSTRIPLKFWDLRHFETHPEKNANSAKEQMVKSRAKYF
jgi:hypothetical protein